MHEDLHREISSKEDIYVGPSRNNPKRRSYETPSKSNQESPAKQPNSNTNMVSLLVSSRMSFGSAKKTASIHEETFI